MDFETIIQEVYVETKALAKKGEVASYIPALASVESDQFGVALCTLKGEIFSAGDSKVPFSIQSVGKVFSLAMAYELMQEKLWKRVGVEPSGTAFNSLIQLELEKGIPRNPLINAGAIVICDMLCSLLKNPKREVLAYIRGIAENTAICYDQEIALSEKGNGYKNYALINLMKSFKNIDNPIETVLDLYFHLSSIKMTCHELAHSFLFLANKGVSLNKGSKILSSSKTKRLNAVMQTCGFYDEAGEFSFRVGLPGKSGVGGGIAAVYPGKYSIAVWSPALNKKGNSYKGLEFLERFTSATEESIF